MGSLLGMCRGRPLGPRARPFLVAVICVLEVVIDSVVPTKVAFPLCGAIGLSLSVYIMPCLIFLRLDTSSRWYRRASLLIMVFGLLLLLGSTPVTVRSARRQ